MMRWTELDRMLEPSRRLLLRQLLGFAAVGVVGTAAHFATLLVLVQKFHLDPVWSSVIGFIVGYPLLRHVAGFIFGGKRR